MFALIPDPTERQNGDVMPVRERTRMTGDEGRKQARVKRWGVECRTANPANRGRGRAGVDRCWHRVPLRETGPGSPG